MHYLQLSPNLFLMRGVKKNITVVCTDHYIMYKSTKYNGYNYHSVGSGLAYSCWISMVRAHTHQVGR